MSLIQSLLPSIDSVLGVRDQIGAALKTVKIMTRTWTGSEPGDGTPSEVLATITPTPMIVQFGADLRIKEGGAIREGDIVLKGISKNSYPLETSVDCSSSSRSVEKFYEVGGALFQVIHVTEKYVTWDVHLRSVSDQRRYP